LFQANPSALLGSHSHGDAADPVDPNHRIEKFLADEFFKVDQLFSDFCHRAVKAFTVIGPDRHAFADVLGEDILDGGQIVQGSFSKARLRSSTKQARDFLVRIVNLRVDYNKLGTVRRAQGEEGFWEDSAQAL
jgi:hypothetical protein